MILRPRDRLLFIGDSVTDCGRLRPVGGGSHVALGQGYVAGVDTFLTEIHPKKPVRITNMGISGNTVRDLAVRWDSDVLALEPDWLCVLIGINDVWRQCDRPDYTEGVLPEEFLLTYDGLVERTLPRLRALVLMTPFYVQPLRTDAMRVRMDAYGAIVKKLAARYGAILVDTQTAIDRVLTRVDYKAIAADRVHPTEMGHNILAHAFMRGIGVTPRPRR